MDSFDEKLVHLIQTDPIFKKNNNETNHHVIREVTFKRLEKIINHGFIDVFQITEDPNPFFRVMNTLHAYDLSLAIKTGVNFGLFGAGLLRLGSLEQVKPYLEKLNKGEIFGALAITEIGHGSNLKKLETVATWDEYTHTFNLHTPHDLATKCWIGNATCHATHAIVFAQLEYKEINYGLHTFVVPLRYPDATLMPGIIITDNGAKKGLNGIDNGKIEFFNIVLPRESLLSNFGYINEIGEYDSQYILGKDDSVRFGDLLSTLSGGRGVLASGSLIVGIKANIIACKYAKLRRQFSGKDGIEKTIMEYTSHQLKLIPLVAKSMALSHAVHEMKEIGLKDYNETGKITKRVHAFSSGLKVLCSEHGETSCRVAREACGGHGYALENELALMHNDVDIYKTFEGDNTLLRQEVCKYELLQLKDHLGDSKFSQYLYFFSTKLQESTNIISKYLSTRSIRDPTFLYYLINYKEKHLTLKLVNDLISELEAGTESFDAWNNCLDTVLEVADAFMYRKVFGIFMQSNNKSNYPWIMLFGYDTICTLGLDWYLINHVITTCVAEQIKLRRKWLCKRLVKDLYVTLDKFEIPPTFWQVPMLENCVYISRL